MIHTLIDILNVVAPFLTVAAITLYFRERDRYQREKGTWVRGLFDLRPGATIPLKNRFGTHIDMVVVAVDYSGAVVQASLMDKATYQRQRTSGMN